MSDIAHIELISGNFFEMEVWVDPINKRLRIDDYRGDIATIIAKAEEMMTQFHKEKLIIIGRQEHFNDFLQFGFQCEAMVDGFFRGSDAYYFTKYFEAQRKISPSWIVEDGIIHNVQNLPALNRKTDIPNNYTLRKMEKTDAVSLSSLYKEVFQIYPTPLHDPDYIQKTMDNGTVYYGFICDGNIVSCASAEINSFYCNAELTDCATLSQHRKFGLMKHLLEILEIELKQQGIYCAYSIARAQSFGMNAALHQLGFHYRGRLMNNCYIFNKLEDMNVWVKDLSRL